jgi:hypothetical protein
MNQVFGDTSFFVALISLRDAQPPPQKGSVRNIAGGL